MSQVLKVDDSGVTISGLINSHPSYMFYREAAMNSIEATLGYLIKNPDALINDASIHIRTLHLDDLISKNGQTHFKNKLSFLNIGGMTSAELIKAVAIGGTNKTASLNGNFGVGIKTSVLNWSDLVIITYKNNIGHFAYLVKEYDINNVDFTIKAYADNPKDTITECTDWIEENADVRGYNLDHDFTEVIIVGTVANQNTYTHTFGQNAIPSNHIRENLCKRFFRIDPRIKINIDASANGSKKSITFMTFLDAFEEAKKKPHNVSLKDETILLDDGTQIHYFWDGPCGLSRQADGSEYVNKDVQTTQPYLTESSWATAFSGFVWKNEIYDPQVNTHRKWKTVAYRLGIQDNFSHFRIFVEIPDHKASTDQYRTVLRGAGAVNLNFDSDENLYLILSNMPAWFKEKIQETKKESKKDLNEALRSLFLDYQKSNTAKVQTSKNPGIFDKRSQYNDSHNSNTTSNPPANKTGVVQRKFNKPQLADSDSLITIKEASPSEISDFKGKFAYIVERGGDNNSDLLIYNPEYEKFESIAYSAINEIKNLADPDSYIENAKSFARDRIVLKTALWVMISRNQLDESSLSLNGFANVVSSDALHIHVCTTESTFRNEVKSDLQELRRSREREMTIDTNVEEVEESLI